MKHRRIMSGSWRLAACFLAVISAPVLRAEEDSGPEQEEHEELRRNKNEAAPPEAAPPGAEGEDNKEREDERAGLLYLFPNLYGSLELRHWTQREMSRDTGPGRLTFGPKIIDSKNAVNDQPFWAIRPTLGSTFYEDALDTEFTLQFQNNIGDNTIQKTDAFNFTIWNILGGKFNPDSPWSLGPSAFTDFFTGDNTGSGFAYSDIGFFGEANYQFPIPTGALSLRGYLNPTVEYNSPSHNGQTKASGVGESDVGAGGGSLALTSVSRDPDGNLQVTPNNPLVLAYYGTGITYLPAAVKGLSLMLGLDVIQTWRPVYAVSTVGSSTKVKLDHYAEEACTFNRLTITYKVNDRVSFVDQARHYVGGFYQYGIDSTHPEQTQEVGKVSWENRLSLIIELF